MGNSKSKIKRSLSTSKKHRSQSSSSSEPEERIFDEEREMTYHLSNHSDDDVDRHHYNHFFRRHLFQNHFSVPMEEKLIQGGCKVLDVGCGPGTWLLDLANKYENSYFFGIDIKPIFPNEIKPDNLEFMEADMFNGLPFPDNEFDFAHLEMMTFIIKANQWNYVISELVRVTKPGGFIEFVEFISPKNSGPTLEKLYKLHNEICLKQGVDLYLTHNLDKIIELQPDLSQVHKDEKSFIMGPNGGRAGMVMQDVMISFNSTQIAIDDISYNKGISKQEFVNMVSEIKNELKVTKPELTACRFWAQKIA